MTEKELKIELCGIDFKNPVNTASGTFSSGKEYSEFFDLSLLGAVTVKGVSDKPWKGNPPPRIAETYGGMLNSIGLQNPGVDAFLKDDLPFLKKFDTRIIVNVCGHTIDEYLNVITRLNESEADLYELNISCPNIAHGGMSFGTDPLMTEKVVSAVKKVSKKPLIVKLSPNVTDITEIAKAAEAGGADALSLINSIMGMKIDINSKKPVLANKTGGLSGPAIKPVAVRMVYDVYKSVKLPLIGMGGIISGDDAIEFMLAGASLISVGMASFHNPFAAVKILEGIKDYCGRKGVARISEIVGGAH